MHLLPILEIPSKGSSIPRPPQIYLGKVLACQKSAREYAPDTLLSAWRTVDYGEAS